ncbi:MAG: hypothetical protein Q4E24_16305 [bacterium]|nr:hypothetical protein [bacterium]
MKKLISLNVNADILTKFDKKAEERGISRTSLIMYLINDFLEKEENKALKKGVLK